MATSTYQSAHLANISSAFDPSHSWILASTAKPFPTAAATTALHQPHSSPILAASHSHPTAASLSELNVPTQPQPSLPLPARFQTAPSFEPKPAHPLYSTEAALYGARNAELGERPSVYFGHQLSFSSEFGGGMYGQSGLDTGVRKSRIVNGKEELGW